MWQGPMTGGGRGWCGGEAPRMETPASGSGFGAGRGNGHRGGWRHRHWFYEMGLTGWQRAQAGWTHRDVGLAVDASREQKLGTLRQQIASLEQTLTEVRSSLRELDKSAPDASDRSTV
jgi:hypothetical protein